MSIHEETQALLRSGMLPGGVVPELVLWGEISGGRFDVREGILFFADSWWGFYGRDFEYMTNYAGFVGLISSINRLEGPLSMGGDLPGYRLGGLIDGEGEVLYSFLPDAMTYSRKLEKVADFFEGLRGRVNNGLHPDAQVSYEKGQRAWGMGDERSAADFFWQAYRLDPRSALPAFALGQMLMETEPGQALSLLLEAKKRGYSDESALALALGRVYLGLGDHREAEKQAREILRTTEDARAYHLMAEAELGHGRMQNALMSLKRACALEPYDVSFLGALAFRAAEFGEAELAWQSIRKAEHIGEKHPGLSMAQALLARAGEDDIRAVHFLKEALELEPGWEKARSLLSELGGDFEARREPAMEIEAAPLTEEEVDRRLVLFRETDLEASVDSLEGMQSHFAMAWGAQLTLLPEDPQELHELSRSMHDALRIALRGEIDAMKVPLKAGVAQDFEEFSMSLPMEEREAFLGHSRGVLRDLEATLEQVAQYGFGLLDGGLFMRIFDRLSREPSSSIEALSSELEMGLSLLGTKLRSVLEMWAELFFDQLFEWVEPFVEDANEQELLEILEDAEEDGYVPPAGTSLKNFSQPEELEEPPTAVTPVPVRPAQPPRPRMISPSLAMRLRQPVNHSDKLKRREDHSNPYDKIFQEYIAAHHFIGVEPSYADRTQFIHHIDQEVQRWVLQTGKQPDLYIRIEQGRPQVKIREQG